MNLDLLKKLTKLANHNPNDNEANSSARRVCKMLEEGNFSLSSNSGFESRVTHVSNPTSSNHDWVKDYYTGRSREQRAKYTTWSNVKRSPEPEFSSKPPNSAGNPFRNTNMDDFFKSMGIDFDVVWDEYKDFKTKDEPNKSHDYRCRNCGAYFTTDSKESTIECNICKGEARRL